MLRSIVSFLVVASLCACLQTPARDNHVRERRQRAGEAAINAACHNEGYNHRKVARALEYIEFVRHEAGPEELSQYIRPEIWRSCARSDREGVVRGSISQLLYEKGTEAEIREDILSLQFPPGFCEMAPAVYGPVAAPRLTTICQNLGYTPAPAVP